MAATFDFAVDSPPITLTADPKWLNAKEVEVPGAKMDEVTWNSPDPRVVVSGDNDLGSIAIADPTLFTPGEQVVVNVTGQDGGNTIILECVLTALEPDTTATHGDLTVAPAV